MTKQLNTELENWIDDNMSDGDFIAHPDFVYDKLLELQNQIEQLTKARDEQSKQLSDRESRMSGYLRDIEQLQQENNELKVHVNKLLHHLSTLTKWNNHVDPKELSNAKIAQIRTPKQSLAEHDKQTAIKAIEDMYNNMNVYSVFSNSTVACDVIKVEELELYISQLKDSK